MPRDLSSSRILSLHVIGCRLISSMEERGNLWSELLKLIQAFKMAAIRGKEGVLRQAEEKIHLILSLHTPPKEGKHDCMLMINNSFWGSYLGRCPLTTTTLHNKTLHCKLGSMIFNPPSWVGRIRVSQATLALASSAPSNPLHIKFFIDLLSWVIQSIEWHQQEQTNQAMANKTWLTTTTLEATSSLPLL